MTLRMRLRMTLMTLRMRLRMTLMTLRMRLRMTLMTLRMRLKTTLKIRPTRTNHLGPTSRGPSACRGSFPFG
jgi:hypothetical protein